MRTRFSAIQKLAIAGKAKELKLEGIRAELSVVRTARCAAAWEQRSVVADKDIDEAWLLCLGHRQPNLVAALPPSHTSGGKPPEPPLGESRKETAPAPMESRRDPLSFAPTQMTPHLKLQSWMQTLHPERPHQRASVGIPHLGNIGSIAWIACLVSATRSGWTPSKKGFCLLRLRPARRANIWCFLDASRSTGMSRSFAPARDILAGLAQFVKSARFHLLVLEKGETRWLARNATPHRFAQALSPLKEASGKSLILQALHQLQRARLKQGACPGDHIVISSDGLASPKPGESLEQTQLQLHSVLRRLTDSRPPMAWLHPLAKRGLAKWLPRVCQQLPILRIAIQD